MNKPVCELDTYFLRTLSILCLDFDKTAKAREEKLAFEFEMASHKEMANRMKMTMNLRVSPSDDKSKSAKYVINASIEGYFTIDTSLTPEKAAYVSQVNTATILYGILRGEIAAVTGSFANGRYILPTVMMPEVLLEQQAAAKQIAKTKEPFSKRRGPQKSKTRTTKAT